MRRASMDAEYFVDLYERDSDPWNFATSPYEHAKYDATLTALPRRKFRRALEVGCSIGVLTQKLAQRCDALVAIDPVPRAIAEARKRCASPRVHFAVKRVPDQWPRGSFDLVLFSEVLYYLTSVELEDLAGRIGRSLEIDGSIVMVHWTGPTDYPLSADDAVETLVAALPFGTGAIWHARTPDYRIDVAVRTS